MRFFLETTDGTRGYFTARDRASAVEIVRGWYRENCSPLTDTPDGPGGFCPEYAEVWQRNECIVRFVRNPLPPGARDFGYLTIVWPSWAQTVHLTDERMNNHPSIPDIIVSGGPTDIHGRPVQLPPDE
jgi:hypothetical protein